MVPEPLIVAVVDAEVELVKVIEPEAVHEEKWYPELAVAVIERDPEFSQTFEPDGVVEPLPDGATANVTVY